MDRTQILNSLTMKTLLKEMLSLQVAAMRFGAKTRVTCMGDMIFPTDSYAMDIRNAATVQMN